MALASLLLFLAASLDRLLKNFASEHQGLNISLLGEWFTWQAVVNPAGPLGVSISTFILNFILIIILIGLAFAVLTETKITSKFFLLLALVGVLSNYVDRISHDYIVDVFALGALSFNLADIYIVGAIVGYLFLTERQYFNLTRPQNRS
jgi:lipoprotein signal peptidase